MVVSTESAKNQKNARVKRDIMVQAATEVTITIRVISSDVCVNFYCSIKLY